MLTESKSKSVLFIIVDQLRYDTVGYIDKNIHTPNIDKLSEQSTKFGRVYSQSPQCQPSRASIFTGRYPTAHKVWWNSIDLPYNETTIGHMFEDTHTTAFFGKSHFSNDDSGTMVKRGFRYSYLYDNWRNDMPWDISSDHPHKEIAKLMKNKYWCGKLSKCGIYHDDVIVSRAVHWLSQQAQPYFAVVSLLSPHPPYAAPLPYNIMYDQIDIKLPSQKTYNIYGDEIPQQKWREIKSQYYSMITWADDLIGKLLDIVDENTIIVFTSDHGDILGDHGHFSKGLFTYDGNTRVPLLIRDKSLTKPTYDHIVQSIDILPTILSLCCKNIPYYVHGKDLSNAINYNQSMNEYALSMVGYDTRVRMIYDGEYKYWSRAGKNYLFNMLNDPNENNNINDSNVIYMMRSKLLEALINAEDKLPIPNTDSIRLHN